MPTSPSSPASFQSVLIPLFPRGYRSCADAWHGRGLDDPLGHERGPLPSSLSVTSGWTMASRSNPRHRSSDDREYRLAFPHPVGGAEPSARQPTIQSRASLLGLAAASPRTAQGRWRRSPRSASRPQERRFRLAAASDRALLLHCTNSSMRGAYVTGLHRFEVTNLGGSGCGGRGQVCSCRPCRA